jgi:hypothetical protein
VPNNIVSVQNSVNCQPTPSGAMVPVVLLSCVSLGVVMPICGLRGTGDRGDSSSARQQPSDCWVEPPSVLPQIFNPAPPTCNGGCIPEHVALKDGISACCSAGHQTEECPHPAQHQCGTAPAPAPAPAAGPAFPKRGTSGLQGCNDASALGLADTWHYNWGLSPDPLGKTDVHNQVCDPPRAVEFVPMFWGCYGNCTGGLWNGHGARG